MDFHSLSRRDLQALCKRNKIPANITNIAMADALKALQLVEGLDEFLEPSQSETAQSSIESPVRSDATSPYVPPTGGRTTRRRNVAKEEPETANPMTRSRRTIRKTIAYADDESQIGELQTPSMVGQTNRKKGLMASAYLKMDSQLKECVEEEKKDAMMTPAQLGVTSTRRRGVKEESAVTRVYSTRRSTRLAVKSEVKNEQSSLFKTDLLTKDGENMKMNLKDSSEDMDKISEINEVDANTTVEKVNSDKKDESEHVSAQKEDIPIGNEKELVCTIEQKISHHFEADASKQGWKESSDVKFEDAELDEEKCDMIIEDSKDEEIEIAVVNEDVVLESEDNNAVQEFICDADICDETGKKMHNDNMDSEEVSVFNVNEEVLKINTEVNVDVVEEDINLDNDNQALDSIIVEAEESTDVEKSVQINKEKDDEVEIVQHDEPTKTDMDSRLVFQPTRLTPIKNSASKASSATKNRMAFILSDNKENIGSGGKFVLTKEKVKMAKNTSENDSKLDDLSMRKLTKMLKEKLTISNKSSESENDDEIKSHVLARPALQAIPENR